jgi:hypothetical protein
LNQSLFTHWRIWDIPSMRKILIAILLASLIPMSAHSAREKKDAPVYRWVDAAGVLHYGDSVPPEYAEVEKQVMNSAGITVEVMRGKKTAAERTEELLQQKLAEAIEAQRRSDAALLATYLSIDEIVMHRDRRIELFQAQAKVTELYLSNIKRRLDDLMAMGATFAPYNADPDAEMIDPELADNINDTRDTIERHEANLDRFHTDEELIASRFDGDINRFKTLKGIE